jgi:hypothetical protein
MQIWHPFILFQMFFFQLIFFANNRLQCRATSLNDFDDWLMPIFKLCESKSMQNYQVFLSDNQYKNENFRFFLIFSTDSIRVKRIKLTKKNRFAKKIVIQLKILKKSL